MLSASLLAQRREARRGKQAVDEPSSQRYEARSGGRREGEEKRVLLKGKEVEGGL